MAEPAASFTLRIEPDPAKIFPDDPQVAVRAQVAAINRSLVTGRARIRRRIGAELELRSDFINRLIRVRNANFGNPAGTITIARSDRPKEPGIPLGKFKSVRQTRRGVAVSVRKSKGREIVKGAFLATMASGRFGVWHRMRQLFPEVKPRRGPQNQELPIGERFGPTLTEYLINAPRVLAEEMAGLLEVMSKNALSQIQRFLAKKK